MFGIHTFQMEKLYVLTSSWHPNGFPRVCGDCGGCDVVCGETRACQFAVPNVILEKVCG